MNPSRYNFSNSRIKKPIGSYIVEAARHEPKRSMSNARLTNTIFVLFMGLFLAYSSLFYVPAALNMHMVIGTSTSQDGTNLQTEPNAPWYTPLVNLLQMKRGYFKAGSEIRVAYNATPGAKITLYYNQCSGIPVLEIFSCPRSSLHRFEADGHRGEVRIPVHKNGFYNFSQAVEYKSSNGDYVILWGR